MRSEERKPKELILRPKPVSIEAFDLTQVEPFKIIACPNPPIAAVQAGHAIAIPNGTFDVGIILEQLPGGFEPELVSLSARVMTFLPRGLNQIRAPKVMKIGDTFHLGDGSLSGMIEYCQMLDCDYHWTYQSVQHLHFFVEAGLKNVFWLPGSIVIDPYVPKATHKRYGVIFRGSESELHVYRSMVLNQVQAAGIAIDIQSKSYTACLDDYANAQIVLNCSLNGDLNRRVFEVLMAGGFLLSDRISSQAGIFELFEAGVHFETYGSASELVEKIEFYLANPNAAEQIAKAGQQKFLECYSQHEVQQKLYRYIFTGEIESPFRLEHDSRVFVISAAPTQYPLKTRLKFYETIQELHRLYSSLSLLYWQGKDPRLLSDLSDLPRLQVCQSDRLETIPSLEFQLVVIDGIGSFPTIQQQLQEVLPFVSHFLFIVGSLNLYTLSQLNFWLKKQHLTPVSLTVKQFGQRYDLDATNQYWLYQKTPVPATQSVTTLLTKPIRWRKVVKDQIKKFLIIDRARQFLRRFSPR